MYSKKKPSREPLHYDGIVKYRDKGTKPQHEEVCLRFVPRDHEINAVYHTPLTDLLSRDDLPLLVRLRHDLTCDRKAGKRHIKRGHVMMLHFVTRPRRVLATDRRGKDVVLPFFAKQLYDILPIEPSHDDKIFKSTAEVIECKPLPKHLRVLNAFLSEKPQESQEAGDLIDISHIERDGNKKVLVGRNKTTREAVTYSEQMTSIYTTMLSETPLSLSEIVSTSSLPVRYHPAALPTGKLDLEGRGDGARNTARPSGGNATPEIEGAVRVVKSKEGVALAERISEGEDKLKREIIAEQRKKIKNLERQVGAANAPPPLVPSRQKPAPPGKTRSRSVVARTKTGSTYNVIQFPPVAAPRKIDPKQMEIDGLKKAIETLQKEKKEHLAKIAELQAKVDNNSPQHNEYQSIPEKEPYASRGPSYESLTQTNLESATVEDVVDFVSSIGLSAFAEAFKTEDINGALLLELDEDIFHTDLGLPKLNAKRLTMEIAKRKR